MTKESYSKFGARLGVSKQSVSRWAKAGKLGMSGGKIDVDHPLTQSFLVSRGVSLPTTAPQTTKTRERSAAAAPSPTAPPGGEAEGGIRNAMHRAGLEAARIEEQTEHLRIRNAEKRGELIPRALVTKAVIEPLEQEQVRILSDGCETIAVAVRAASVAGSSDAEVANMLRDHFSTFFEARKRTIGRLLGVVVAGA